MTKPLLSLVDLYIKTCMIVNCFEINNRHLDSNFHFGDSLANIIAVPLFKMTHKAERFRFPNEVLEDARKNSHVSNLQWELTFHCFGQKRFWLVGWLASTDKLHWLKRYQYWIQSRLYVFLDNRLQTFMWICGVDRFTKLLSMFDLSVTRLLFSGTKFVSQHSLIIWKIIWFNAMQKIT